MQFQSWIKRAVICAAMLGVAGTLQAQGVVKLGLVAEFSGPFAQYGQQILGGMKAYMKQNGDTVAGKKIEIVQKDTTGPAPDVAKRLAQELVTRDNVDFLVGFGLTPNAMAVASGTEPSLNDHSSRPSQRGAGQPRANATSSPHQPTNRISVQRARA